MDRIGDTNTSALIKAGLRSLAASIPFAGSLAQAWSEYEAHSKSERVDEFFRNFHETLVKMEIAVVRVQEHTVKSGELPGLIEKTVEKIQRELSARKRKLYVNALLGNLAAGPDRSYDEKLNIIETLDVLTESDLLTLSQFSPDATVVGSDLMPPSTLPGGTFTKEQENVMSPIVVSLAKLEARGLICETKSYIQNLDWSNAAGHWVTKVLNKSFQLLPFGKVFLDSLREPYQPIQQLEI